MIIWLKEKGTLGQFEVYITTACLAPGSRAVDSMGLEWEKGDDGRWTPLDSTKRKYALEVSDGSKATKNS